ncbi:phosphotransferase family protein [Acidovorax carolinensis]|uniref:Phosphotransferase family protein n=1 Tax=Acidovorax carolinensis TaxID=553814 RepID=A0A240UGQ2_9BURK|nr:phosphotransferase family protein [Acidovorax carolinensis]ART54144.1 phosphotransferase family protein [Acidovorax carolinensis]ART60232.1 phosphotransferase family protein [Acidovorax carolinensis]
MSAGAASLPLGPLADYLRAQGLAGNEAIEVAALSGGQSNPTFRVTAGENAYVVRKKPAGVLAPSAHAIDREYRVMRALQETDVPVPRMRAYCEDASILGTPFYVMDFLQGRVFMDPALPDSTPAERGALYRQMGRVMAALHSVDHVALGLADYGRTGRYVERQIDRWSRQCRALSVPLDNAMRALMDWLPAHLPAGDETTLVHGDYRIDNLVFHPTEPQVIGVLDWELSTLGDPLADLAYHCMAWNVPPALWRGIGGLDLAALGIPSEAQYLAEYRAATGRDAQGHWSFYMAYNLFRMAAILYGIAQRAADGSAASADAEETGRKAGPLAQLGWEWAQRHTAR